MDALTTETSTTVANPSGTFTLNQSFAPARIKSGGVWKDLDPTLHAAADGTVLPAATANGLVLSGGGTRPLATLASRGRTLSLGWPTPLPAPKLDGATATYAGVIPGVDLVVTALAQGGVREVLVVRTRQAAADPRLAELTMTTATTGGLALTADAAGNLAARASVGGEPVFAAEAPRMWDSSTTAVAPVGRASASAAAANAGASSVAAPGSRARMVTMKVAVAERAAAATASGAAGRRVGTLTLVPDRSLLTDPAAVLPVYLDPTWNDQWAPGAKQAWVQVDTISGSGHWKPSELQNGYDGWSSGMVARDFVQFGVPSQIQGNAQIYHSDVYLTVQHGPYGSNCSGASSPGLQLWWTGGVSTSTSEGNQPSWIQNLNTQYPKACDGQNVTFDVTSFMRSHAGAGNMTFGLRASDEGDMYAWKEINASTVTMSTDYDRPPDLPNHPATSPGGACQTTDPALTVVGNDDVTFQTVPTDPDGGQLGTQFVVKDYATGSVLYDTGNPATASASLTITSGQVAQLVIPRAQIQGWHADGTTHPYKYAWYTLTSDGKLTSPTSGTGSSGGPCLFTYDPTAPASPSIGQINSPVAFGSSLQVPITAAPNTNPARFTYSLNDGPTTYAPGGGASQTVTVTPNRVGINTLSATAISAGGNPSPAVTVAFTVNPPAVPYSDGDFTGEGRPDLLTVGSSTNAGLWLSPGNGAGTLSTPANIGIYGTGLNTTRSPSDWTGTQVLHGDFTGDHVQDVLAYNPAGSGALMYGNGDATPLLPTAGNQKNLNVALMGDAAINSTANGGYGDYPTRLVAAGNATLAGNPVPDLVGVAGDSGGTKYELNLYTGSTVETYSYASTIAPAGVTPDGNTWNAYTFAVAQPTAPFHQTALFALNTATGSLWEAVNTTDGTTTSWTAATPSVSWTQITGGPWGAGTGPALVSADVNANGAIELWTQSGLYATPYTLSGTALTAGSASRLFAPAHEWPLNDGTGTVAADTATTSASNASLSGGATWQSDAAGSDAIRGTTLAFDGKTGFLQLPTGLIQDGGQSMALTLSFQAAAGASGILFSTGHDVPANNNSGAMPVMYIDADGNLYAQFWNGAVSPLVSRFPVTDGQWHTATLTASGNTQTLYLDNQIAEVNAHSAPLAIVDPYDYAGAGVFNTNGWVQAPGGDTIVHPSFFQGRLSDIVFYGQAVGTAELSQRNVPAAQTGTFVSGVSGSLCVDDSGALSADGNHVQIYTCNDNQAQNWTANPNGELNMYGKCLDVTGAGTSDGTKVELWQCVMSNGQPVGNQTWQLRSDGSLYNPVSGRCLDDSNSTTTVGTQLQIWTCNGSNAQKWSPLRKPVVPVTGTITLPNGSSCVDNSGGSATSPGNLANNNVIQVWACDGYPSQQWTFNPDGTVTLAGHPGWCLDVTNAGSADGTKIQLLQCHNGGDFTGYQAFQSNGTGIWNPGTAKCWDSGSGAAGVQLQIWSCNGTNPQKFTYPQRA